jgi:ABC-2 type transport system permease protein
MKTVLKQEIMNYLKNPILWLGMFFILIELFQILNPYLELHYFTSKQEIKALNTNSISDRSILEGYITSSKSERMELALNKTQKYLIEEIKLPEQDVTIAIQDIRERNIDADTVDAELQDLLGKKAYSAFVFDYYYDIAEMRKASVKEANTYIREKLEAQSYSWYFGRKFADFTGLFMGFFSAILMAFLFLRDSRKDMYELLHTKPISSLSYVAGKVGGGFCILLMTWGVLVTIFGILCEVHGRMEGFPVNILDFVVQSAIYNLPNLLMIVSIYAIIAIIFKNPLPATPLLFLYIVYSNMGSTNANGDYGYYGRPLAIMVRFPGNFLDTAPPPMVLWNQIFLIIVSVLIICLCAAIWKRRRVY